jgi:hypothetical protein
MDHGVQGDATPAIPATPKKRIRSRDDLSFTRRDDDGRLWNWAPTIEPTGNWYEDYQTGKQWFEEVVELVRRKPNDAAFTLTAVMCDLLVHDSAQSFKCGFIDALNLWAITGILCNPPAKAVTKGNRK